MSLFPKHLTVFVSITDPSLSTFVLLALSCYMLILVGFICLITPICNCGTFMISNKWNRVFTQCSIFLALSPYNWNRVITRSSKYLASVALFVRLLPYFLLSLPYYGLIALFRLLLPHFGRLSLYLDYYMLFIWLLSLVILLNISSYGSDAST